MADAGWTWEPWVHPRVASLLAEPAADLGWCVRLDHAPTDSVVGKVLCVCAAVAISREVLAAGPGVGPAASDALALLDGWIDDFTEERFRRICGLIFPPDQSPDFDPHGLVRWALRTATSTAEGYGEAGWALETTCSGAVRAGLSVDQLRAIAERAVLARRGEPR
jgi:hypothetical protein